MGTHTHTQKLPHTHTHAQLLWLVSICVYICACICWHPLTNTQTLAGIKCVHTLTQPHTCIHHFGMCLPLPPPIRVVSLSVCMYLCVECVLWLSFFLWPTIWPVAFVFIQLLLRFAAFRVHFNHICSQSGFGSRIGHMPKYD